MHTNGHNSRVPAERKPSDEQIQHGTEFRTLIGYLPPSETISAEDRLSVAREEGYDWQAIELAWQPSESSVAERLRLTVLAVIATAAVIFFFPTDRFFKPRTKDLGTMTIGGPITANDTTQSDNRNEPWFDALLKIDRLYFAEGKISDAIEVAESALRILPEKNWESWKMVHYRYWELLSAAGRVQTLKAASQAYLQKVPEDPFANYYYAQAFLMSANRMQSFSAEMKQRLRQEAQTIIGHIESACNALGAQRRYDQAKEKDDAIVDLLQKLRVEQANVCVLIWKLGAYQEDSHPDVVFRDKALDICDSTDVAGTKEAKQLKIEIYTQILDRWWWFEGSQIIQGVKIRRKTLEQDIATLAKEIRDTQKL